MPAKIHVDGEQGLEGLLMNRARYLPNLVVRLRMSPMPAKRDGARAMTVQTEERERRRRYSRKINEREKIFPKKKTKKLLD